MTQRGLMDYAVYLLFHQQYSNETSIPTLLHSNRYNSKILFRTLISFPAYLYVKRHLPCLICFSAFLTDTCSMLQKDHSSSILLKHNRTSPHLTKTQPLHSLVQLKHLISSPKPKDCHIKLKEKNLDHESKKKRKAH